MAEVRLEKLTKVYASGATALRDLDLSVKEGEFMVLMGPSGCGKTTTLRLISGLEEPTSGTIRIGGDVVNELPADRRDVGMMFQRPALYPHLRVRQNLEFGLKLRGQADVNRTAEIAGMLKIGGLLDRLPSQLSGGEQQRVALGRALLRRPRVLLLDEPLSNLDGRLRHELRRELNLLHGRLGITLIHVTHDQAEAMTLGQRVAVLDRGVLQQVDTPVGLYDRPANHFVAGWLGMPPMSFLVGKITGEGSQPCFRKGSCSLPIPTGLDARWAPFCGRPLTVGLRPEILVVADSADSDGGLPMTVVMVDSTGDRNFVTLRRESWELTGFIDGKKSSSYVRGETLRIRVNLERAHLFDGVTGMALCHPDFG